MAKPDHRGRVQRIRCVFATDVVIAFWTPGGNHVNRAIEDALQLVLQVEQIKQRAVRCELAGWPW